MRTNSPQKGRAGSRDGGGQAGPQSRKRIEHQIRAEKAAQDEQPRSAPERQQDRDRRRS